MRTESVIEESVGWDSDVEAPYWKRGRFGLIVLLHVAVFYAFQSGAARNPTVEPVAREVQVSFISTEERAMSSEPETVRRQPPPKSPVRTAAPDRNIVSKEIASPVAEPPRTPDPTPQTPSPPAANPAQPLSPAQPKTISSEVEYLQAPRPEYPAISKRQGEEGKVDLRVLVSEAGRPQRVEVVNSSGVPRLDEAARQAVMRALFKPHIENGKPVTVFVLVPINFELRS
jgi:protein TonB